MVANASFEVSGTPLGTPQDWTLASVASGLLAAGFTYYPGWPPQGIEPFDEWFPESAATFAAADFDPGAGTNEVEDFEGDWLNNAFTLEFDASVISAAFFNASITIPDHSFDGFERLWSNEGFASDLAGVTTAAATFDVSVPESFEDFEEEWQNDSFADDLSLVTTGAALFDGGTDPSESFSDPSWPTHPTI